MKNKYSNGDVVDNELNKVDKVEYYQPQSMIGLRGSKANYHSVRHPSDSYYGRNENSWERYHEQNIVKSLTNQNNRLTKASDIGPNLVKKHDVEFWHRDYPIQMQTHNMNMKFREMEYEKQLKLQQDIDDGVYYYGPKG